MRSAIEFALEAGEAWLFGQIAIHRVGGEGFVLTHRDEESRNDLPTAHNVEDALELARFDDAGNYRALKTAPNLRHGWCLHAADRSELARALDYFYPGRLALLRAWKSNDLATTPLRQTLARQTGMYRVAAKISDQQIDDLVGNFCRSDGGCLRTILWKRDEQGHVPSTKLPATKFDPCSTPAPTIPLLCQEACNLLVAECRKAVKSE
jgi:sirohydrochlorin cobaltochelatase